MLRRRGGGGGEGGGRERGGWWGNFLGMWKEKVGPSMLPRDFSRIVWVGEGRREGGRGRGKMEEEKGQWGRRKESEDETRRRLLSRPGEEGGDGLREGMGVDDEGERDEVV